MKITNPILPKQEQKDLGYFLQFTKKLSKISCVYFALYGVKLAQQLNFSQRATNCINLVEEWLKTYDTTEIVLNELRETAGITWTAENIPGYQTTNAAYYAAWTAIDYWTGASWSNIDAAHAVDYASNKKTKTKLLNYLGYLLPKEPEFNNFNIDLLKQNPQAYNFLENISKLEDRQVTNEDLFGIRQIFDVLEEVGVPLDPNEFIWDGDITEKHKLLQTIRREFIYNA